MPSPTSSNVLVIVESPTKARTIEKFLPRGYVVKASVGHVRDLPKSAADIPAKIKKLPWARLGVDIEHDFKPIYVVPKDKKSLVKEIRAAVRKADHIFFATDEDREGESISWHLLDLLGPGVPFERLVFHEITRDAIRKALREPRGINQDLVSAQETRRIVDRLFGYEVSPLLWKKMAPRLSAGRVQSVAVRLLVERERGSHPVHGSELLGHEGALLEGRVRIRCGSGPRRRTPHRDREGLRPGHRATQGAGQTTRSPAHAA